MNARPYATRLVSALVLLIFLGIGGWVGFHLTHPVSIATIECNVGQGPPDDTALTQWLSSQPVILKSSVIRAPGILTLKYKLSNSQAMDYAPSVVAHCKQLGYAINGNRISSNANPFLGTVFFPDPF